MFVFYKFSDDILDVEEMKTRDDVVENTPFLQAVDQIRQKHYESVVDLCTKEIDKGWSSVTSLEFSIAGPVE